MGLLLEQIELLEGKKEMTTIISTMRKLGKDVDEVRQYLEKSTGKSLDDISDVELAKIAATGANAGQAQMNKDTTIDPADMKDYKQLQTALSIPGGSYIAAPKVRQKYPSGTYPTQSPDGKTIDIDVDISASDLDNIYSAVKSAGKTFPKALDDLKRGNIGAALGKVIDKIVAPSTAAPKKSQGNWNK